MQLKVKKLHPDAHLPRYATDGAGCFDLHVIGTPDRFRVEPLEPGEAVRFRTGLAFEVPAGHVMLIFSRSGHGFNNDVRLSNCVGVIDSDYRGEVMVKLRNDQGNTLGINHAELTMLAINPGDRIAQALVLPIPRVELVEVDALSETARGAGGFGSTGSR